MTVGELIDVLTSMDQALPVILLDDEYGTWHEPCPEIGTIVRLVDGAACVYLAHGDQAGEYTFVH